MIYISQCGKYLKKVSSFVLRTIQIGVGLFLKKSKVNATEGNIQAILLVIIMLPVYILLIYGLKRHKSS